eukprot:symbB.v1.2.031789.t1/scaffold3729.1/size67329/1
MKHLCFFRRCVPVNELKPALGHISMCQKPLQTEGGPFAVGTFSFHAPDLCESRWPADGSHRHSLQDINAVDRRHDVTIKTCALRGYSKRHKSGRWLEPPFNDESVSR